MAVQLIRAAFDRSKTSGTARSVLVALCDYANDAGEAWPSVGSLAIKAGVSRRTVFSALRRLESLGEIERLSGRGRYNSNSYRIKICDPMVQTPHVSTDSNGANPALNGANAALNSANPALNGAGIAHNPSLTIIEPSLTTNRARKHKRDNPTRKPFDPEAVARSAVSLGSELDTAEFWSAWREWCNARAEQRKPMTETAVRRQIANLERWGVTAAIASIHASVANGWQGLFEPRQALGKPTRPDFRIVENIKPKIL